MRDQTDQPAAGRTGRRAATRAGEQTGDLRRDRREDPYHLDGNALGGVLSDVFGREVTAGHATCSACGSENPLGAVMAYVQAPGHVLRCPGCGEVLFVVVHRPDGYRVTFDRLRVLQLPEI